MPLEWNLLEYPVHKQMQEYVKALNHLYTSHPAMYELDDEPEGFEWINCTYQAENIAIFIRRSSKPEETLLFVCNFAPVVHEKFRLGVPFAGKYKEIFNSDSVSFGGSGVVNPRAKQSREMEWDGRKDSIQINLPPMAVSVFQCTPESGKKKAGAGKSQSRTQKASGKTSESSRGKTVKSTKSIKSTEKASPLDKISGTVGRLLKK